MFDPDLFPQLEGPITFELDSGVKLHEESPDTFYLPAERMWVIVQQIKPEYYVGTLDNQPYCTEEIGVGFKVEFHADHVIQVMRMA
jgi:hypothetical protein